jgi:hypothetical protein
VLSNKDGVIQGCRKWFDEGLKGGIIPTYLEHKPPAKIDAAHRFRTIRESRGIRKLEIKHRHGTDIGNCTKEGKEDRNYGHDVGPQVGKEKEQGTMVELAARL